jgi:hypothetical protein
MCNRFYCMQVIGALKALPTALHDLLDLVSILIFTMQEYVKISIIC